MDKTIKKSLTPIGTAWEVNPKTGEEIKFLWNQVRNQTEQTIEEGNKAIQSGAYKNWIGQRRVKMVDDAFSRGNIVVIKYSLQDFNGVSKSLHGLTQPA